MIKKFLFVLLIALIGFSANADVEYINSDGLKRNACFDVIYGVYVQMEAKSAEMKKGRSVPNNYGGKTLEWWQNETIPMLIKVGLITPSNAELAKTSGITYMALETRDANSFFKNWNEASNACGRALANRAR